MRRALLLMLVLSLPSLAAESRWGLRWRAPEDCISAAELASQVETRLGKSVFGINPDYRVDGLLEAQEGTPKWKARITVVSASGDVLGSREVTGNESCRALDEKLAFVVAVSIDPSVALSAPAPEPKPAPPVAAAPAPVAPQPGGLGMRVRKNEVYVEIESDDPDATLYRHVGTSWGAVGANNVVITTIEKSCETPCKDYLENTRSDFFISGKGISLSPTFSLSSFEAVKLKVKTGSSTVRWLGWTLTVFAASTLIVGIACWVVGAVGTSSQLPGVQNPYGSTGTTLRDVGMGLSIGGAAALAAGIPMIAFSGTKVELFPLPSTPAPLPSNISEI